MVLQHTCSVISDMILRMTVLSEIALSPVSSLVTNPGPHPAYQELSGLAHRSHPESQTACSSSYLLYNRDLDAPMHSSKVFGCWTVTSALGESSPADKPRK